MFIADYHTHCNFSDDSDTPMEDMVKKAISVGLKQIAFTDHVDYDYPNYDYSVAVDYEKYLKVFPKLKDNYKDKIKLILGVEIGLQPHLKSEIENTCDNVDFDFIISSTHVVDRMDLYNGDFFEGKSKEEAYRRYFEDVFDNIKIHDRFDVYGHLDYVNRYGEYSDKTLDYNLYSDIIDEILKLLIKKGKGIELNTSGYRYKLNHTHPTKAVLKRYRQLGGEIITVGSDAHDTENIALHFKDAYELLKEVGFKYITLFEKRKPEFVTYDI